MTTDLPLIGDYSTPQTPLNGARIGVVTFPGTLDDVDALRAVRLTGAEAVSLWHADDDAAATLAGLDAEREDLVDDGGDRVTVDRNRDRSVRHDALGDLAGTFPAWPHVVVASRHASGVRGIVPTQLAGLFT